MRTQARQNRLLITIYHQALTNPPFFNKKRLRAFVDSKPEWMPPVHLVDEAKSPRGQLLRFVYLVDKTIRIQLAYSSSVRFDLKCFPEEFVR